MLDPGALPAVLPVHRNDETVASRPLSDEAATVVAGHLGCVMHRAAVCTDVRQA